MFTLVDLQTRSPTAWFDYTILLRFITASGDRQIDRLDWEAGPGSSKLLRLDSAASLVAEFTETSIRLLLWKRTSNSQIHQLPSSQLLRQTACSAVGEAGGLARYNKWGPPPLQDYIPRSFSLLDNRNEITANNSRTSAQFGSTSLYCLEAPTTRQRATHHPRFTANRGEWTPGRTKDQRQGFCTTSSTVIQVSIVSSCSL